MEIEDYWSGLLLLTDEVKKHQGTVHYCFIRFGDDHEVHINRLPVPDPKRSMVLIILHPDAVVDHPLASVISLEGMFAHLQKNLDLSDEVASFLCIYLPYCFLPLKAHQMKRAVAITHFAQSLDGKIATLHGDSKWIGNEQNLIHAHRMRALCDSILIGSKTMNYDQPSLTVRLVQGKNPKRIVICSSESDFSSLQSSAGDKILVMGLQEDAYIENAEYIRFTPNQEGRIDCSRILSCLYQRGIHTVYIEGGAATSSQFMKEKMIDVVQLHIAPVIFGSGVSCFMLPEIERVQEAIFFERYSFKAMGNTYMFIGEMNIDTNE